MYGFILHAFNYQDNVYKIKYNGKEFSLEDKLNKIIETDEEYLEMDLLFSEEILHHRIQLCEDFVNEIIFDLDESRNNKYNVELLTLNYHNEDSNILLHKGKEIITLDFPENDLRIGKILILNTDLNFKITLKDMISKKIKSTSDFANLKKNKKLSNEDISYNLLKKKLKIK